MVRRARKALPVSQVILRRAVHRGDTAKIGAISLSPWRHVQNYVQNAAGIVTTVRGENVHLQLVHREFSNVGFAGSSSTFPGLLDKFYDSTMRPVLSVIQDTCGRHDTFGLACTALGHADRGFPGHLNCSENISHALDPHGVEHRAAWPAKVCAVPFYDPKRERVRA